MDFTRLRAAALLLCTSLIWGFAFVAQRQGMEHLGPFTFNALRFALGALAVAPVVFLQRRRRPIADRAPWPRTPALLVGALLFGGASLQQAGLMSTSAGKGGFITGIYVILVPLASWFLGRRPGRRTLLAALLALGGLYLLSVRGPLGIERGDLLIFAGAFCWAGHVLVIDRWAERVRAFELAAGQFVVAALASTVCALAFETTDLAAVRAAAVPLAYTGILSSGVAFSFQVIGQRATPPTAAAILLSFEAVFAALGGWWLLSERLDGRGLAGCALLFAAMLLAQTRPAPSA